jgi:hypothetical protein
VSVAYLVALSERVNELAGELMHEAMKAGDSRAIALALKAGAGDDIEPDSERTQLADHLMQQAKDRRERGES